MQNDRESYRALAGIVKQVVELRGDDETDEYGVLRATEHACERSCQLITDAAAVLARDGHLIPRGCASTDSEGGVRIDWVRSRATVCLMVPASAARAASVYHEVAGECTTEPATLEALACRLRRIS